MLHTWFMDAGLWKMHLTQRVQAPAPGEERWLKSMDQKVVDANRATLRDTFTGIDQREIAR